MRFCGQLVRFRRTSDFKSKQRQRHGYAAQLTQKIKYKFAWNWRRCIIWHVKQHNVYRV